MTSRALFRGLVPTGFVVIVMILSAAAMAGQRGQVGGPPTLALGPPDEGKRTTPDLVIGRTDLLLAP